MTRWAMAIRLSDTTWVRLSRALPDSSTNVVGKLDEKAYVAKEGRKISNPSTAANSVCVFLFSRHFHLPWWGWKIDRVVISVKLGNGMDAVDCIDSFYVDRKRDRNTGTR